MSHPVDRLGARVRAYPAYRFAAAAALAARVIAGYKLLDLRHRLRLGVPDLASARRRHHYASAGRIYDSVVRLQGLMIKIGQTIGSNPVGFPFEYVEVLSRLQDAVPPHPWAQMRPAIERALGRPIDDVFDAFDPVPVAAASLAQVYRARLRDGRPVAVKVLYPGIERLVRSDLRVLHALIWLDGRVSAYEARPIYEELARNVPLEVDLVHEGHAMEAMAEQLRHDPRIVIPGVVWEHTSRRLLVMEWIDGIKITDRAALDAAGNDRQALSDLLLDCYCRQLLVHGFFHADPHPGNLFALPGDRLAIVDFGLTKRLTPDFRRALARLTRAMFTRDIPGTVAAFDALGYRVKRMDDQAVFAATTDFLITITDPSTYETGPDAMQSINERWLRAVKANPVVAVPGDATLVWRVFALLTGVGASIGAQPRVLETVMRYTAEEQPTEAARGGSGAASLARPAV